MKPFAVALCVIIDDYGRLLLTHRTIGEFTHWELPGGHIEEEETAEYAAVREAQEKLGVAIRLVKSLGKELSEELDQTYSFDYFQAVISLGEPTTMNAGRSDDIEYFDYEDLPSLALSDGLLMLLPKLVSGDLELDG